MDNDPAAAERCTATVTARAAVGEAVGALRSWQHCGTGKARSMLREQGDAAGMDAEATRVAGIVDATAYPVGDPDWD